MSTTEQQAEIAAAANERRLDLYGARHLVTLGARHLVLDIDADRDTTDQLALLRDYLAVEAAAEANWRAAIQHLGVSVEAS